MLRRYCAFIVAVVALALGASRQPASDAPRTGLDLAGPWRFVADPQGQGESHGFMTATHDSR
jgi:hypothetical protein